MTPPTDATTALAPVRTRLLRDAAADAEALLSAAGEEATAAIRAAETRAAGILAEARREGARDAERIRGADRARARRTHRARELAVHREIWEELRLQVVRGVEELGGSTAYPAVRRRLTTYAQRVLGPDARITEAPGGGVVGEVPGRRIDCALATLARRALDRAGGEVEELWAP
ncbi:hypothetical protein [Streptomyces sp. NPDC005799]|uniref:hypothetical protein n=1 Tax=Streptomyces sp. NPDC005799 TaxID=3154678 RepID=UPI00340C40A2